MGVVLVLFLVGGAVLRFVDPPFFIQAHQVGVILMIISGALLVLQFIAGLYASHRQEKFEKKYFGDGWFGR